MSKYTRQQIIDAGIDAGATYKKISNMLKSQGYNPEFNPLLQTRNYINLGKNAIRNAGEFARNLKTFGGVYAKPIIDISKEVYKAPAGQKTQALKKAFVNAVNNDVNRKLYGGGIVCGIAGSFIPRIGPLGGAILGSQYTTVGGRGMADAVLSTYDTSLSDISNGRTNWRDVAQAIFRNPVMSGIDLAPVYGRGLSKGIGKLASNRPEVLRQLFPDKAVRDLNRQITNSIVDTASRNANRYQGLMRLKSSPLVNRTELVKNIIANEGNLNPQDTKLAELIKGDLRRSTNDFVEQGLLDEELTKNNTISQYANYKLGNDNILHGDIVDYVNTGKFRPEVENYLSNNPEVKLSLDNLIKEGNDLYDNGKIEFLTQKFTPTTDPAGNIIASDLVDTTGNYFDMNRIIGKATPEKIGTKLDDALDFQLRQLNKTIELNNVVNDIIKSGKFKYIDDVYKLNKNELNNKMLFNEKVFKDYLKQQFQNTGEVDLKRALRTGQGTNKNGYLVDNLYVDMIKNAFDPNVTGTNRKLLNTFKKTVLAQPVWIIMNRLGNIPNNLMNGVTAKDYLDVILDKSVGKNIPEQLKQQTSFYSYINPLDDAGLGTTRFASFKEPVNRMFRAGEEFKASKKRLKDYGKLASNLITSSSDITANPFYKLESSLELLDRSAAMVREAKRYAENHNIKDWKKVLNKVNKDSRLFNELNNEINKSLGDYSGRNYALPSGVYHTLSEFVPFYRFLFQTGRTTANQLLNNPLGYYSTVQYPAKMGELLSQEVMNRYGLTPEEYQGGMPYSKEDNNVRTIGIQPYPIGSLLGTISDVISGKNTKSILSPFYTTLPDILSFRRGNKQASTPRKTMLHRKDYKAYKNFKPTTGEMLKYGANELAATLYNPYLLARSYLPDIMAALKGTGLQNRYDTDPFTEDPDTFRKLLLPELLGRYFGITTQSNYKERKESAKTQKSDKLKEIFEERNIINKRNREIE